jgi:hypothetical protein
VLTQQFGKLWRIADAQGERDVAMRKTQPVHAG